jgi:hypothetical protein
MREVCAPAAPSLLRLGTKVPVFVTAAAGWCDESDDAQVSVDSVDADMNFGGEEGGCRCVPASDTASACSALSTVRLLPRRLQEGLVARRMSGRRGLSRVVRLISRAAFHWLCRPCRTVVIAVHLQFSLALVVGNLSLWGACLWGRVAGRSSRLDTQWGSGAASGCRASAGCSLKPAGWLRSGVPDDVSPCRRRRFCGKPFPPSQTRAAVQSGARHVLVCVTARTTILAVGPAARGAAVVPATAHPGMPFPPCCAIRSIPLPTRPQLLGAFGAFLEVLASTLAQEVRPADGGDGLCLNCALDTPTCATPPRH